MRQDRVRLANNERVFQFQLYFPSIGPHRIPAFSNCRCNPEIIEDVIEELILFMVRAFQMSPDEAVRNNS